MSVGKVIHSMVAHLDAVTSLAIDPSGLYLLSGSESFQIYIVIKNDYMIQFQCNCIYHVSQEHPIFTF